jgi:hypothetical protein
VCKHFNSWWVEIQEKKCAPVLHGARMLVTSKCLLTLGGWNEKEKKTEGTGQTECRMSHLMPK